LVTHGSIRRGEARLGAHRRQEIRERAVDADAYLLVEPTRIPQAIDLGIHGSRASRRLGGDRRPFSVDLTLVSLMPVISAARLSTAAAAAPRPRKTGH
jgi:hypothetical protein